MVSALFSLLPSRFSRPILSLLIIAAASLALQPTARAQTFSSSGTITIPNGSGTTVPTAYPTAGSCTNAACIPVSGLTGSYTSMSITLNYSALNQDSFGFPAILLESPGGAKLDILSFGCAYELNPTSVTFTLSDSGTSLFPPAYDPDNEDCPGGFANSTYKPAAYEVTNDIFPSPGPGGSGYTVAGNGSNPCSPSNPGTPSCPTGTGTFANTFCSSAPCDASGLNGTWKLYAVDQANGAAPTAFTWSLTFNVTANNAATTTTLSMGSPNPAFTSGTGSSVSLPVTVTETANSSLGATSGTVTLMDITTNTALASHTFVSADNGIYTFAVTLSSEGTHVLQAQYGGGTGFASSVSGNVSQTAVNHATQSTSGSVTSFCNSGPITLSSNAGGNPYPSLIVLGPTNITGDTEPTLSGTISSVSVSLNGLNLQSGVELDDLGVMLQAPGATSPTTFTSSGNAFEFLSWAGNPYTGGSLTFSDDGTATIPFEAAPTCTTCLPTDDTVDLGADHPDTFPSPAPATFVTAPPTGSGTFLAQFGGGGVSGTWSLYLVNRLSTGGTLGSLGSWCLNFTTQINAHPTATLVHGSPNPASTPASTPASVALTANVTVTDSSGLTADAGTVTFADGATNLGSAPVSNGQATLNVSLAEGTHQIVASYGGTDTGTEFGVSSATFDQRVDTATTIPTSGTGAGPYTFCNSGAIVAPGLGNAMGPASPYPSNIFVTGLPGTVNAVTVTLNRFSTADQRDLLSLLVGPGGNNLDFFSLTGGNIPSGVPPSPFNLTFADGGASISGNLSAAGTYAPTSFNTDIAYPQCPPNAPLCANPSMPVGPPLASNPFTPTNKAANAGSGIFGNADTEGVFGGTTSSTYNGNGTWSLYLDDGGPLAEGIEPINVNSGWCVSLTQNLPSISVTAQSPSTFTQGGTGSFPVTITNEGAGPIGDPTATAANAMTVTDTLPPGLTYSSFTGTDWSCAGGGQTAVCTNQDTVAPGANYSPLSINVNVSSTASGGNVTNTVSVTDTEASNNTSPSLSSSATVTIDVPPAGGSATSITFISGMAGSFTVTTTAGIYPTAALGESGGLPGTVTFTDNRNGTGTLAGTVGAANSYSITFIAQNGVLPNASQSFTLNVLPGLASRFAITVPPTATVGAAFNFTVTACDAFGNQATGYNGTVHFSSSDPGVLRPANATLTNGAGTFSATLVTPGTQTMTATDTVNPGLTITSSGILVSSSPNFGSVNVCPAAPCNKTQTFSFNIPAGTTIGSVNILTTGAPNLDFQAQANDTSNTICSAQTYSSATTCTVDVTFAPLAPGQRNGAVQIVDGSGNILATTYIYGTGVGPAITFQSGALVGLGSGITGVAVAVDASGNVYVGDQGNETLQVQEVLAAGGYTTTNTLAIQFDLINGLAVDGSGNVFVAASDDHEVYEIPAVGGSISMNNPSQAIPLLSFDSNLSPYGVAVDGNGNLYVADNGVNMVYEIPSVNGSITYPANPSFITLGSGFTSPQGVAVDGSGNVFVSDYGNHAVKEILAAGGYTTVNTLTSNYQRPQGVAVDASGNVYFTNTFDAAYEILAVNGSVPSNPTIITLNTLGSDAFTDPTDLAVDARGNVYVADPYSTQITKLDMADPPTLSFASTIVGATSSDSPKSVTVQNIGNATLTATGLALSDTTDFAQIFNKSTLEDCTVSVSLAASAECNLSFSFTPQSVGPLSGTLTLSDNALNGNPATQTIQLGGNGTIAATTTTLMSSPNPSLLGQSVTFTATVTPKSSGPVPTGAVNFEHLGFVIGTETLSNGVASFTTSTLPANVAVDIVAVYSGSSTYAGSTSAPLAQAVTGNPTTTTLMSSSNPSVLGQPVTFTATVEAASGVPTGSVRFEHLGATLAIETLSNGVATFPTSALPLSDPLFHVVAVYFGNATDAGSTSAAVAQTVNKAPTTTALMSSSNPSVLGQSVTFTATVQATYGDVPSGTVRFEHLGALLGTGTLSDGVASIATSALPANVADHIVAVYTGSATNTGSTSRAVVQTVH